MNLAAVRRDTDNRTPVLHVLFDNRKTSLLAYVLRKKLAKSNWANKTASALIAIVCLQQVRLKHVARRVTRSFI